MLNNALGKFLIAEIYLNKYCYISVITKIIEKTEPYSPTATRDVF